MKLERQARADVVIGEPRDQDSVMLEIRANWKNCGVHFCCYNRLSDIHRERIKSKAHFVLPPTF